MIGKIEDQLYVGDKEITKYADKLRKYGVTTILNITGEDLKVPIGGIGIFNYALPSQELLPTEIQKTVDKLTIISRDIQTLKDNQNVVLIVCPDGKNQSILAAGYYLITKCGHPYMSTIKTLETLYFTEQQKTEDLDEIARVEMASNPYVPVQEITQEQLRLYSKQRDERRAIQCLTIASFSKLLRIAGGAKK